MRVPAWYFDLNGIENKNIVKFLYATNIKNMKTSW